MPTVRETARHIRYRRRLSHRDPSTGLSLTHHFVAADSGFDVGDAFPDRDRPVTVAVTVQRDGSSAQGVILELGDATTGLAIWIPGGSDGDDINASAGGTGDDGVTLLAKSMLIADGQRARIVFSVVPASGEARLWVNGELRAAGKSVTVPLPNGWAADSAAGIGEVQGTASDRIPAGDKITLANASIVTEVQFAAGQRPQHFDPAIVVIPADNRVTESGDNRITESGDNRVLES